MKSNTFNLMNNIIFNQKEIIKPEKVLKEADYNSDDSIKLFMNTWKNYNENGADADSIGGGWMDLEQAKEFAEAHKEEEPFINDTDNCPLDLDEYSDLSVIDDLIEYEDLDATDKEVVQSYIELQNNDLREAIEVLDRGDYMYFSGVDNEADLAREYIEQVGFPEGEELARYVDEKEVEEEIKNSTSEELSEEDLASMAEEEIENAVADGDEDWLQNHFDFEYYGRDMTYEGWSFSTTGAIQFFKMQIYYIGGKRI